MKSKIKFSLLLPILFSFFVMGFVDVVGISTSYVQADFNLSNKVANLLPSMVFLWFAVCSLPTGILMGRIGRKRTVLLSAVITFVGMLLPAVSYSFATCMIAFALLGIGNTILQVSLNPMVMDVIEDESSFASLLTMGQFFKAISSTLGPIIVGGAVAYFGNWKLIFPVYAAITLISWLWLYFTKVNEVRLEEKGAGEKNNIWTLFKDPYLLMLLSIIVLSVGYEIGLMTAVPKYLGERCGMPLDQAGLGCSLYYVARTLGTFLGSIILARVSPKKFLTVTMVVAIAALGAFMIFSSQYVILTSLFVLGLMCANIFAIAYAAALQSMPERANEISALMIMGVAGGALIPPVMGIIADASTEFASLYVILAILIYMFGVSFKIKTN